MPDAICLPYHPAVQLFQHYAIPLARQELVQTSAQAGAAAQRIGLPVALKAVSPAQSHKSEAGLVRLNLSSISAVERTAVSLLEQVNGALLEGLLVQEMVTGGVELIAGVTRDPQFGPLLMVGSGGILVELLEDVALAVPPLTHTQARELLRQTQAWKLLGGYRGRPAGDIAALEALLCNLSRLALEQASQVTSLDLNPVIVLPAGQGVKVVDARVFCSQAPTKD